MLHPATYLQLASQCHYDTGYRKLVSCNITSISTDANVFCSKVPSGSFPKNSYHAYTNSFRFLFKLLITLEERILLNILCMHTIIQCIVNNHSIGRTRSYNENQSNVSQLSFVYFIVLITVLIQTNGLICGHICLINLCPIFTNSLMSR